MQAVIRVFSTFGVHSHLKCFSGPSSSQKSSQLILASHSPISNRLHPSVLPSFSPVLPLEKSGSWEKSLGPYSFSSASSIPPCWCCRVLPAQLCLRTPLPVELLLCSHTTACRPQGGEPPSLSSAVLFSHHQSRDRINTTTMP